MCRQPPPIGSKRSPYSLWVQGPAVPPTGSSRKLTAPAGPLQAMADECCMPKLCPGSCTSTTQPEELLYQVFLLGRFGVPLEARPDQLQPGVRGWMYQREWS